MQIKHNAVEPFGKIKMMAAVALVLLLGSVSATAQPEFDGIRGTHRWPMFTDAPNSLYKYLSEGAYAYMDKRAESVASIKTLDEWQKRQEWAKKELMSAIGAFPDKTSLNVRVTSIIKKDKFNIENFVYESQPGYYVTASLFVPNDIKNTRAPAIIYCSGHSDSGYRSYQSNMVNLVLKGFIVLAFDPIGQGERLQYYDEEKKGSRFQYPTYEHSYPGAQTFLTGNSAPEYFIWDGIRAVDYLLTRKDVDPARIGITGRSGGGTQSAMIAAFDDRIKAAAPENYITSMKRLYQSMGPQDAEQNFHQWMKRGLDMADLLLVRGPKPALVITTTRDMFPYQGATETAAEVARMYAAYGKPGNFRMITDDAAHASTKKNTERMYAFFQKHLNNPGDSTEIPVARLEASDLRVTPTGQLATSLGGETTFSLNSKTAEKQMQTLRLARKNVPAYLDQVLREAKVLSGFKEPSEPEAPFFTGRAQREGYTLEKLFIYGEGGYAIPYLLMRPVQSNGKALLYINPDGKKADSGQGGDMEWFAGNGFTVLSPDIIGTGEMGPGVYRGDSYIDSVSYNLWFAAMNLGKSIAGIRAADMAKLAKLLKRDPAVKEIYALAKREMAPALLHAAAFDKNISAVALIQPYSSYRELVTTKDYHPDFIHSTVAGAIGKYDLPDLAASLAPRRLLILNTTDAEGNYTSSEEITEDLLTIESAYRSGNALPNLHIIPHTGSDDRKSAYEKWIE